MEAIVWLYITMSIGPYFISTYLYKLLTPISNGMGTQSLIFGYPESATSLQNFQKTSNMYGNNMKKIEAISCSFSIPPIFLRPFLPLQLTCISGTWLRKNLPSQRPKWLSFFFKFQRKYFNLWNRMHFIIKTISVGYYL